MQYASIALYILNPLLMARILIIEDNLTLGKNISRYLSLKGYNAEHLPSVEDIHTLENPEDFDLYLLDIHLPGMNGNDYLVQMRESGNSMPVIFLTSKDSDDDIIEGLKLGADDYVSKPFDYEVLIARIESVLRRSSPKSHVSKHIMLGKYKITPDSEKVFDTQEARYIYLSHLEFKLLMYFIQQRGKICDRASIYEEVWGEFENYHFSRTVDVYISYLRKKLDSKIILTRKGSGYSLGESYE